MRFLADLRLALRTLLRAPGFFASASGVLALGIAAVVVMFGFLRVTMTPPPLERVDRVFALSVVDARHDESEKVVRLQDLEDWGRQQKSFEGVAGFMPETVSFRREGASAGAMPGRAGEGAHVRGAAGAAAAGAEPPLRGRPAGRFPGGGPLGAALALDVRRGSVGGRGGGAGEREAHHGGGGGAGGAGPPRRGPALVRGPHRHPGSTPSSPRAMWAAPAPAGAVLLPHRPPPRRGHAGGRPGRAPGDPGPARRQVPRGRQRAPRRAPALDPVDGRRVPAPLPRAPRERASWCWSWPA